MDSFECNIFYHHVSFYQCQHQHYKFGLSLACLVSVPGKCLECFTTVSCNTSFPLAFQCHFEKCLPPSFLFLLSLCAAYCFTYNPKQNLMEHLCFFNFIYFPVQLSFSPHPLPSPLHLHNLVLTWQPPLQETLWRGEGRLKSQETVHLS